MSMRSGQQGERQLRNKGTYRLAGLVGVAKLLALSGAGRSGLWRRLLIIWLDRRGTIVDEREGHNN